LAFAVLFAIFPKAFKTLAIWVMQDAEAIAIVAFELTSILFIAAMVGAILLAKRENQIIE
jgi:hypothetical protein